MTRTFGYEARTVGLDTVAILAVVPLLAAIYFLTPHSLQNQLALHQTSPAFYQFFTNAYVHFGPQHLYGNLIGYVLGVVYVYWLCLLARKRRWFRITFAAFLTLLPILASATSYLIFAYRYPHHDFVSRGFSGVVAGFGGFAFVALVVYLNDRHGRDLASTVGIAIGLVMLWELGFIYSGGSQPVVSGLVVLGLCTTLGGYYRDHGIDFGNWRESRTEVGMTVLVFAVLSYFVFALFPANLVDGSAFTNIFAHLAGFGWGGVTSVMTIPYSTTE